MPYQWIAATQDQPERLHLWPHRSLTRRGFVWFMGLTSALVALPILSVVGSAVLWFVLAFVSVTLCGIWLAIRRSWRDAEIIENLTFQRDTLTLIRQGPRGRRQDWQANPYWVRVTLHPTGGPVPNYLTLKGDGREVELGAFLTEEERITLLDEVQHRLSTLR